MKIIKHVKRASITVSRRFFTFVAMTAFMNSTFVMSAQHGAGAFNSATTEIQSYLDPVKNLLYAIAGVIVLVGCFNIYFKMQNGDQDVKKTIMLTIGGCIAMVALANALPKFFGM